MVRTRYSEPSLQAAQEKSYSNCIVFVFCLFVFYEVALSHAKTWLKLITDPSITCPYSRQGYGSQWLKLLKEKIDTFYMSWVFSNTQVTVSLF